MRSVTPFAPPPSPHPSPPSPCQHLGMDLDTQGDTVGGGGEAVEWWRRGRSLGGGWRPLEEGAGALWGRRRCVRGAVAHGEDVVVAGQVGGAGQVVGVLGEAGGHPVGSVQDADRRL